MAKPLPTKVTVTRSPLNGDPDQVIKFDFDASTPAWMEPFEITRSLSNGASGIELVFDHEGRRFSDWEPGDFIRVTAQGLLDDSPVTAFSGFIAQAVEEVGIVPRLYVSVLSLKELLDAVTVRAEAPATGDFLCAEDGATLTAESLDELLVEVGVNFSDGDAIITQDYDEITTEAGVVLVVEKP